MKASVAIVILAAVVAATGCANLGGGRQVVALPWSAPNIVFDSLGTVQKNDDATGAAFSGAACPVSAAEADNDTRAGGQFDQGVIVGGNAATTRSTDANLAGDQSAAQGRQSGDQTGPAGNELDDSLDVAVPVNSPDASAVFGGAAGGD